MNIYKNFNKRLNSESNPLLNISMQGVLVADDVNITARDKNKSLYLHKSQTDLDKNRWIGLPMREGTSFSYIPIIVAPYTSASMAMTNLPSMPNLVVRNADYETLYWLFEPTSDIKSVWTLYKDLYSRFDYEDMRIDLDLGEINPKHEPPTMWGLNPFMSTEDTNKKYLLGPALEHRQLQAFYEDIKDSGLYSGLGTVNGYPKALPEFSKDPLKIFSYDKSEKTGGMFEVVVKEKDKNGNPKVYCINEDFKAFPTLPRSHGNTYLDALTFVKDHDMPDKQWDNFMKVMSNEDNQRGVKPEYRTTVGVLLAQSLLSGGDTKIFETMHYGPNMMARANRKFENGNRKTRLWTRSHSEDPDWSLMVEQDDLGILKAYDMKNVPARRMKTGEWYEVAKTKGDKIHYTDGQHLDEYKFITMAGRNSSAPFIVIDIDDPKALDRLYSGNAPLPDFILWKPLTGHAQAFWKTTPIYVPKGSDKTNENAKTHRMESLREDVILNLKRALSGDPNMSNHRCQNPYYKGVSFSGVAGVKLIVPNGEVRTHSLVEIMDWFKFRGTWTSSHDLELIKTCEVNTGLPFTMLDDRFLHETRLVSEKISVGGTGDELEPEYIAGDYEQYKKRLQETRVYNSQIVDDRRAKAVRNEILVAVSPDDSPVEVERKIQEAKNYENLTFPHVLPHWERYEDAYWYDEKGCRIEDPGSFELSKRFCLLRNALGSRTGFKFRNREYRGLFFSDRWKPEVIGKDVKAVYTDCNIPAIMLAGEVLAPVFMDESKSVEGNGDNVSSVITGADGSGKTNKQVRCRRRIMRWMPATGSDLAPEEWRVDEDDRVVWGYRSLPSEYRVCRDERMALLKCTRSMASFTDYAKERWIPSKTASTAIAGDTSEDINASTASSSAIDGAPDNGSTALKDVVSTIKNGVKTRLQASGSVGDSRNDGSSAFRNQEEYESVVVIDDREEIRKRMAEEERRKTSTLIDKMKRRDLKAERKKMLEALRPNVGERNKALFTAATWLKWHGFDPNDISKIKCEEPLPKEELSKIVRQVEKYYKKNYNPEWKGDGKSKGVSRRTLSRWGKTGGSRNTEAQQQARGEALRKSHMAQKAAHSRNTKNFMSRSLETPWLTVKDMGERIGVSKATAYRFRNELNSEILETMRTDPLSWMVGNRKDPLSSFDLFVDGLESFTAEYLYARDCMKMSPEDILSKSGSTMDLFDDGRSLDMIEGTGQTDDAPELKDILGGTLGCAKDYYLKFAPKDDGSFASNAAFRWFRGLKGAFDDNDSCAGFVAMEQSAGTTFDPSDNATFHGTTANGDGDRAYWPTGGCWSKGMAAKPMYSEDEIDEISKIYTYRRSMARANGYEGSLKPLNYRGSESFDRSYGERYDGFYGMDGRVLTKTAESYDELLTDEDNGLDDVRKDPVAENYYYSHPFGKDVDLGRRMSGILDIRNPFACRLNAYGQFICKVESWGARSDEEYAEYFTHLSNLDELSGGKLLWKNVFLEYKYSDRIRSSYVQLLVDSGDGPVRDDDAKALERLIRMFYGLPDIDTILEDDDLSRRYAPPLDGPDTVVFDMGEDEVPPALGFGRRKQGHQIERPVVKVKIPALADNLDLEADDMGFGGDGSDGAMSTVGGADEDNGEMFHYDDDFDVF